VSAELGYSGDNYGMLRARATRVGPWEKFTVCSDFNGQHGLRYYIRSQANRRYVSAEVRYSGDDRGMLRARATGVGPWEEFTIRGTSTGATYLWSQANRRYVSAEVRYSGDDRGMLRARATRVGPWENFGFATHR
jgi:hypothetical protein